MIINVPGVNTTPSAAEIAVSDEVRKLTGVDNVDNVVKSLVKEMHMYDLSYTGNGSAQTISLPKDANYCLIFMGNGSTYANDAKTVFVTKEKCVGMTNNYFSWDGIGVTRNYTFLDSNTKIVGNELKISSNMSTNGAIYYVLVL